MLRYLQRRNLRDLIRFDRLVDIVLEDLSISMMYAIFVLIVRYLKELRVSSLMMLVERFFRRFYLHLF